MKNCLFIVVSHLIFSFSSYGSEQFNYREKEMAYRHTCLMESDWQEDEYKVNIALFKEKLDGSPQAIFLTDIDNVKYVGRKYISDSVIHHNLPGFFCSKIKKDMILGKYHKNRLTQDYVIIYFQPISQHEKEQVFSKLLDNRTIDICYPYVQLIGNQKREKVTPEESWIVNEDNASFLGIGEETLRAYTLAVLPTLFPKISEEVITIYDPACSTGQFLAAIHHVYPHIRIIGQDLSKSMVDYALQKIPEVYHGNSLYPCMPHQSVDLIIFRFLNSEVVTTTHAYDLFNALVQTVKKDGYLILFGHTPVLIDLEWFQFQGLTIIQTNGLSTEDQSVFQYYVLKNQ